jgi:hypothetical protein
MHQAVDAPQADARGRLQLTMKGSSNPAADAYSYDVTNGAARVIFAAPGLGSALTVMWAPIPGTSAVPLPFTNLHGIPLVAVGLFAILLWACWPVRRARPAKTADSPEIEAQPELNSTTAR